MVRKPNASTKRKNPTTVRSWHYLLLKAQTGARDGRRRGHLNWTLALHTDANLDL